MAGGKLAWEGDKTQILNTHCTQLNDFLFSSEIQPTSAKGRAVYCFDWVFVFAIAFQLSPFPRGTRQLAVGPLCGYIFLSTPRWSVSSSLFNLNSLISFLRPKKEQKRPAHGPSSRSFLCSRCCRATSLVPPSLAATSLSAVCRVLRKDVANERNASLLAGCTASAAHLSRRQRTACGNFEKI